MNTCRTGRAAFLSVLLLILFQTGAALAQGTAQTDPPERRIIAWTNPVLFVFGWYIFEAESRLEENHTVGISGSFLQFEDGDPGDFEYQEDEYSSVSVFYRYYPTASFEGFFIGAQLGRVEVKSKTNFTDESGSAFSAGVLIGYGWLLGDAERIGVSLGFGANRLFGDDVEDDERLTLPVIRLINVGIAF